VTATPSDGPSTPEPVDRRLHPLSWLFVLVQQLKSFAVPLLLLLVTGRGNTFEFVGLYGVALLVSVSVVRYFTYRFRLDASGVVIRSGLFQITRRDIPYERIHNVSIYQTVLHRLFGVAELRLESASGARAEAEMRVLSLTDAQQLEQWIRQRGAERQSTVLGEREEAPRSDRLHHLPAPELIRLGLISNRGMVVVAAAFGALWQFLPDRWLNDRGLRAIYRVFTAEANALLPTWLLSTAGAVLAAGLFLLVALIAVRVLSVALALLQFYDFTLEEVGRQLRIERGLLTRIRTHVPRRRIQAWRLIETPLHRWFGRQSLRVDTAGGEVQDHQSARDLVPLAAPEQMRQLIRHVLEHDAWPPASWLPLHPHAWRRLIVGPSLLLLALIAISGWQFGWPALLALLLWPLVVLRARIWARHAGYAQSDGLIAVRTGWLNRSWEFTDLRKLQTLRITASPFDRRHGMATIWLDTAGASTRDGVLRIPYLPAAEARRVYEHLALRMDPPNHVSSVTDAPQ
jgi:putative membrane protein